MHLPFPCSRLRLSAGFGSVGEGRASESSQRATLLVLFPQLDGRPGPWLMLLTGTCSYIAIRALELGIF